MSATATNVSLHGRHNLTTRWCRVFLQEGSSCHDHSGSTIRTLKNVHIEKCFLYGMKRTVFFETFNRGDLFSGYTTGGCYTRARWTPVNENRTRATNTFTTTVLAACQVKFVAQNLQQRYFRGIRCLADFLVYSQFHNIYF